MILGIDIDDTITNTSEVVQKYLKEEYPCYDESHLLPRKEYKRFLKKYIKKMRNDYGLKEGIQEAWAYFQEHHFKIIIITAKNKKYDRDNLKNTIAFLKQNGLFYDKIYFKKVKKGKTAYKERVDLFIDDKESVLDEVSSYGINCICMGNSKKYKSFCNWHQVLRYIKEEYHG